MEKTVRIADLVEELFKEFNLNKKYKDCRRKIAVRLDMPIDKLHHLPQMSQFPIYITIKYIIDKDNAQTMVLESKINKQEFLEHYDLVEEEANAWISREFTDVENIKIDRKNTQIDEWDSTYNFGFPFNQAKVLDRVFKNCTHQVEAEG